jgi:hypothetical protein
MAKKIDVPKEGYQETKNSKLIKLRELTKGGARIVLINEDAKPPEPKIFEGKCPVCQLLGKKGDIVEDITSRFNPMMGPPIIGPGSKGQYHDVHEGYHCLTCGLKYKFVPGENQEQEPAVISGPAERVGPKHYGFPPGAASRRM